MKPMKPIKIVLASDNHLDKNILEYIYLQNKDADHYFLCGDSQMKSQDIKPFKSVRGNNDFDHYQYPKELVIKFNEHFQMLIIHGDSLSSLSSICSSFNQNDFLNELFFLAKEKKCNILAFGHTHKPFLSTNNENGITIINPGSTSYPRNSDKSYALIFIEGQQIQVKYFSL